MLNLLPITNKTVLTDSKVLSVLNKWCDQIRAMLSKHAEDRKSSPHQTETTSFSLPAAEPNALSTSSSDVVPPAKKRFLQKAIEEASSSEDSDHKRSSVVRPRSDSVRSDADASILDTTLESVSGDFDYKLAEEVLEKLEKLLEFCNSLQVCCDFVGEAAYKCYCFCY